VIRVCDSSEQSMRLELTLRLVTAIRRPVLHAFSVFVQSLGVLKMKFGQLPGRRLGSRLTHLEPTITERAKRA